MKIDVTVVCMQRKKKNKQTNKQTKIAKCIRSHNECQSGNIDPSVNLGFALQYASKGPNSESKDSI